MKKFAFALTAVSLIAGLAFAGGTKESAAASQKTVTVTGYLLGDAPAGMDLVLEKINEKLVKDVNAKLDIRHISWGDFSAKYPLVLAAGGDVDFIFTANWSYYAQEAAKGAFYEITPESIAKYMPKHSALLNPDAWGQAKVNGKIYMIPTATPDKKVPVAIFREDLRKKYGLAPITRFTDIEPYLAAVKKGEPAMYPMVLDNSYDIDQPFGALVAEMGDTYTDILRVAGSGAGLKYALEQQRNVQLASIIEGTLYDQYKSAARTMNAWLKKGYVNQDAFANTVASKDSFLQGRSAVAFGNTNNIQQALATAATNGWEVGIIPIVNKKDHYKADPYINNGVGIAASSAHPEKTMQVLDLLMADPAYNFLAYFGVEGVNYVVKDGKIDLPAGVTSESNTYPPDISGFWFTNKDQHLPLASWTPEYIALRQRIVKEHMLLDHPLSAFSPDVTNIQTEVASLNRVLTQYLYPFYIGLIDDIDGGFKKLSDNMKASGVDKVRAELQGQIDVYMKNFK